MPIYPVINVKTGEKKEIKLSIDEWDKWKVDNNDWTRDWSDPSTAPNSCELGEWQNKLVSKHPSWNTILDRAGKMPGSKVKKI